MKAKTYEEIAKKHELTGRTAERYVAYMTKRWKETESQKCSDGYADEWADRFDLHCEYQCSDSYGNMVLKEIDSH